MTEDYSKSAGNCPDANIGRARVAQRPRASACRCASCENIVHDDNFFAGELNPIAHGKCAVHVRRALLARKQRLRRRRRDAAENFIVQRN